MLKSFEVNHEIPIYHALQTAEIEVKDQYKILFKFSSSSTKAEFELKKDWLTKQFRANLSNYLIELETEVTQLNQENYVLTKEEKFKKMAEKNPVLWKMKETMGLDFNSHD